MMGMMGGYPGMMGNYGLVGSRFGGSTPTGILPQGGPSPADQTGQFLGAAGAQQLQPTVYQGPRVVPNPTDNSLLILATPDEYESIIRLLHELDVPPRQVLIEARIYEVRLTGAFSWGLTTFLQNKGTGSGDGTTPTYQGRGSVSGSTGLTFSAGMLIGQSRELLALLNTCEIAQQTKVISNPSVVATDSIPASINVGVDVPTLSSQAVTDAQQGGSSLFANTIANRRTGVTLNITARVNPSGVVTLMINQEVSSPQAPDPGGIQSPSFSNRSVNTQVTVQDGDLVAIGGIISETSGSSSAGVPFLHRVPILGYAFGSKSTNKERTELLIFLTPRVIYDTNQLTEASEELLTNMRRLQKLIRE
jgi:general secretion pathway protein D